ncbi:acyl-CoA synthetase (AMP-forming)/AMP-acid ligase II [Bogoriella caseilytica]|uniref:Acyl-CoA synthetase (AMP-forming)/AMP-acid ligase II n=1 Tax=Bogoriella caseilytica TaxID=56055 RepID=A0A3N2BFR0_9MICO|nr:acyl-CoA synthetase (AMP-forming)/AMP-acid ligase II [Bogoriella caseilytica]
MVTGADDLTANESSVRRDELWPGVPASWSHHGVAGGLHWHYLDNLTDLRAAGLEPRGTILAVHGNPTWSYVWRTVLDAGLAAAWRVVAVDQIGMGHSERPPSPPGQPRRLGQRLDDLAAFTDELGLSGATWDGRPVIPLGHDWGGVVASGWAGRHPRETAALILTNTGLHQDEGEHLPALLRLALMPGVLPGATERSPAFLQATLALADLDEDVKDAYRAPYRSARSRAAIRGFVEDIPAHPGHPSHETLAEVAAGISDLERPALLLWGPRDPVFQERYLHDLLQRLPHADVHRFEGASHLLPEDADVAGVALRWIQRRIDGLPAAGPLTTDPTGTERPFQPIWSAMQEQGSDPQSAARPAVVAMTEDAGPQITTWGELLERTEHLALGLSDSGVRAGQRVSLLIPPGPELTAALFAVLRLGAVAVVADAGLGVSGLTRAVRGARPDHIIGIERALAAARTLRWPGQRYLAAGLESSPWRRRALGYAGTTGELVERGEGMARRGASLPGEPAPEDDAAILFTSGSTGPAKGVVHTHRSLSAMVATVAEICQLSPERPFVAGFAPFALLGTATGAPSAVPAMDVTAPATLTAAALGEAAAAIGASAVFASPSALENAVRTAGGLSGAGREALAQVEIFLSAGAPISASRLARAQQLLPNASLRTPYGMTEALPVTNISLEEILEAESQAAGVSPARRGTCVGFPVPGVEVRIAAVEAGARVGDPTQDPHVTGEVVVRGPHVKDRYDRLWATEDDSRTWPGWHRTGDVGHLDTSGRLWIEGRMAHLITSDRGIVTPVGIENAVLDLPGVLRAAAVGVGPAGTQRLVVVVETDPAFHRGALAAPGLAPPGLSRAVRSACADAFASDPVVPVSAVLRVPVIPTDVRHNAKVDRSRLATWAAGVLAGGKVGAP